VEASRRKSWLERRREMLVHFKQEVTREWRYGVEIFFSSLSRGSSSSFPQGSSSLAHLWYHLFLCWVVKSLSLSILASLSVVTAVTHIQPLPLFSLTIRGFPGERLLFSAFLLGVTMWVCPCWCMTVMCVTSMSCPWRDDTCPSQCHFYAWGFIPALPPGGFPS
jgi:hypothetical protein